MKENKKNATTTFYYSVASVYYLRGSRKIIGPGKGPFFIPCFIMLPSRPIPVAIRPYFAFKTFYVLTLPILLPPV